MSLACSVFFGVKKWIPQRLHCFSVSETGEPHSLHRLCAITSSLIFMNIHPNTYQFKNDTSIYKIRIYSVIKRSVNTHNLKQSTSDLSSSAIANSCETSFAEAVAPSEVVAAISLMLTMCLWIPSATSLCTLAATAI